MAHGDYPQQPAADRRLMKSVQMEVGELQSRPVATVTGHFRASVMPANRYRDRDRVLAQEKGIPRIGARKAVPPHNSRGLITLALPVRAAPCHERNTRA